MKNKVCVFLTAIMICYVGALSAQEMQTASKQDSATSSETFKSVDVQPQFPGGIPAFGSFLTANIKYPAEAKKNRVQGRAIVRFVVEKDGSLTNLTILKDPGSGLGDEAVRVLQLSPKWTPGIQKNRPVRVAYVVPVNFTLGQNKN